MFEKCYIIIYLLDCLSGIPISTKSKIGHRGPKVRQMRDCNLASAAKSALHRRFRSWSELETIINN